MTEQDQHPIFVISLADCLDRRAEMTARLDAIGLTCTFIDAVDGRKGLPAEELARIDRANAERVHGRSFVDAEFANTLTHHRIYNRMISEGLPVAIILEDDAIPLPGFAEAARSTRLAQVPMALFDHKMARVFKRRGTELAPGHHAWPAANSPTRSTGYSINLETARDLLERCTPIAGPPDWPIDITRVGAHAVDPKIIDHPPDGPEHSIIGGLQERAHRKGLSRMFKPGYLRSTIRKKLGARIS
ncbi:MAG: glycosyltransferase family 25 protein [Vannielia sp.]|uniref:glycosyltransferase family 25 protein n=1 Tax=Vannielia sp. TaxID=2813045 RepID=UPI003B8BB155